MVADPTPLESVDIAIDGEDRLSVEPGLAASGVYALLASRTDAMQWRPELAPGVETTELELSGGDTYFMVANPDRSTHFRLLPEEAALLGYLDGETSVGELVVDRLAEMGELDAATVVELIGQLHTGGFLVDGPVDVYAVLDRALHPPTLASRADRILRTLTVEWSGAERLVSGLYRPLLRHTFNPAGAVVALALAVGGVAAFVDVSSTHHFRLSNRQFGAGFLVLLALDLGVVFIHELGHATVLVHYRRRVRGAGFRIYFGSPAFFIDSADGLMLGTRRRIFQSAAGPIFELVATSVAAISLWAFPSGAAARTLYQFIIINYFVLFLNLVPMLELDGYWILADALHQPDLRPESIAFVRQELWRKLRRRETFTRRDIGLTAFGLAGVAFTVFAFASAWFFWRRVFGDTILAMWRGGLLGKLVLLLLALVLGGPALRMVVAVGRSSTARFRSVIDRVRFRYETSWRVEAATLLDESTLFGDVPVETLNDIAGRVRVRSLAPGAILFRQGETADAFYIIRNGTLEVVEEHSDGTTRTLAVEGRGAGIGDQGIIEGSPRSATVRARERSEVFQIDKATFDRLLTDRATRSAFAPTVQRVDDLRRMAPFAALALESLADLARRGTWVSLAPTEFLFAQGDSADKFYVIDHGRLEVIIDGQPVSVLGAGDYVGERALLLDAPRSASIRASTPARLYALDRGGFDSLVAEQFRRGTMKPTMAVQSMRDH